MDVLKAVGLEAYNIFHTVSFVESNTTYTNTPRKMRFYDAEQPSRNLYELYQYFGPKTKVSVDYYSPHLKGGDSMIREFTQREGNSFRWVLNGMQQDDVAVVHDADETFTRDFLRAIQICDIPQFRVDEQDCEFPKVSGMSLVFESTPECARREKIWTRPDAILGECVDQIGNITQHPPTKRDYPRADEVKIDTVYFGSRSLYYGANMNYSQYHADHKTFEEEYGHKPYPLWYATDIRMGRGDVKFGKGDNYFTGE